MSHTKEPWAAYQDGKREMNNISHFIKSIAGDMVVYGHLSKEDARRIVACVNACAGIPDDMIRQVVSFGMNGHSAAVENAEARREYWASRWANEFDARMVAEKKLDESQKNEARYLFFKNADPILAHHIFTDECETEWDKKIDEAIEQAKGK